MNYSTDVMMIDTIKLAIPCDKTPAWLARLRPIHSTNLATGTIKNIINPSAATRNMGIVTPNVSFVSRPRTGGRTPELLIEVSLPKLLFGNNFQEVSDLDFEAICQKLANSLSRAGIPIAIEQLVTADVRKIDFCKNVIFNDYTSVSSIVKDIRTADMSKRNDNQLTDYRNGGHIYHIMHTNSLDVSLYDKVADLKQGKISEHRAHESTNYTQFKLLDTFDSNKSLSVARFEVRLNSKAKIRHELSRFEIPTSHITFKSIYRSDIAKKVLSYYWQDIFSKIPKAPLDTDTPEKLLSEILKSQKITPRFAFAQLGYLLCVSDNDNRYIRNLIEQRFGKQAWLRLRNLRPPPSSKSRLKNLLTITSAIEAMQPVDIRQFDFTDC